MNIPRISWKTRRFMCAGVQRTALPDLDRHQYLPERNTLPMAANAQTGCSEPHDSVFVEYRAYVARGRSSKTLLSPNSVSPAHHVESGRIDSRGDMAGSLGCGTSPGSRRRQSALISRRQRMRLSAESRYARSEKKLAAPPGSCVPAGAWQRFHGLSLLSGLHGILSMYMDSWRTQAPL